MSILQREPAILNMVAESKNTDSAGRRQRRPSESTPVGTPTKGGDNYISASRNFPNMFSIPNSRESKGLESVIERNFIPRTFPMSEGSQRGGRGRGGGKGGMS